MKMRKNIYIISIGATLIALSSCGVTTQDEGLGASNNKAMSGVVVDGYLAGAIVYADVNENNKMDAWENRAITDIDGYFSYNAKTSVNYCELPATDPKSFHCLNAPAGYDMVMIRMTKGYDLATVEPFTGTISMRMNLTALDVTTPMAATPITGLLAEIPADNLAAFLATEGLTTAGVNDISTTDFLDFNNALTDDQRRVMLMLALQTHKVADVVANILDPLYGTANSSTTGFFGENSDVPRDASSYVYMAIASEALRTGTDLSTILSNTASAQLVIEAAILNINKYVVDEFNGRLPQNEATGEPENLSDKMATIAATDVIAGTDVIVATIGSTIAAVFASDLSDLSGTSTVKADITSRLRAIDAVVSLTRAGDTAASAAAVALVSDATYMLNLRDPKVNMVSMKQKLAGGATTAAVADFSSRKSFDELFVGGGSPFSATDTTGTVNDQGFGGNTLDLSKNTDESVSVNFVGEKDADGNVDPTAESGTMTIDANLLGGDFATDDGSALELDGTWEKVDDYTMIMNIEVTEGVFEPVIVKPNDDGTGYYFDLGGEQVVWQ